MDQSTSPAICAPPVWAGEIPIVASLGTPIANDKVLPGVEVPDYLDGWTGPCQAATDDARPSTWGTGVLVRVRTQARSAQVRVRR